MGITYYRIGVNLRLVEVNMPSYRRSNRLGGEAVFIHVQYGEALSDVQCRREAVSNVGHAAVLLGPFGGLIWL